MWTAKHRSTRAACIDEMTMMDHSDSRRSVDSEHYCKLSFCRMTTLRPYMLSSLGAETPTSQVHPWYAHITPPTPSFKRISTFLPVNYFDLQLRLIRQDVLTYYKIFYGWSLMSRIWASSSLRSIMSVEERESPISLWIAQAARGVHLACHQRIWKRGANKWTRKLR